MSALFRAGQEEGIGGLRSLTKRCASGVSFSITCARGRTSDVDVLLPPYDAHTMLIPIRLQINIQLNFLTITNHGRSRERKAAKPEASAGQAKLRKLHRPMETEYVQSKTEYHVRVTSETDGIRC